MSSIKQDHNIASATGAVAGAMAGGALGSVVGPVGTVAGAAIGAVAGSQTIVRWQPPEVACAPSTYQSGP